MFGGVYQGFRWARANRLVFHYFTIALHRRGVGADPVVVTILTAIFYKTHPRASGLEGLPQVCERFWRHIRVTHDVVIDAEQLGLTETADGDEIRIDVCDGALGVGC